MRKSVQTAKERPIGSEEIGFFNDDSLISRNFTLKILVDVSRNFTL